MEGGLHILIILEKTSSFCKRKEKTAWAIELYLSLQSFIALSGFADLNGFTENLAYMPFALTLTFLFRLSICLFPLISVLLSPFSSFFLNLPFADSFCLCDLPHFIQSVCSYRNRVFWSQVICSCLQSQLFLFPFFQQFLNHFQAQYVREGQRSKV